MRYKDAIRRGGDQMSAKGEGKIGHWKPRAWTPDRCAVWQALPEDRRQEFENWVGREPELGGYPDQVSAEWLAEAKAADKSE